jgi:hypothetical protein
MRRFDMRLPAMVKLTEEGFHEMLTETQNVSARGVFLYVDRPVAPNTRLEVTLTLPSQVTLADAVRVRFVGRILRVEPQPPTSRFGIAAIIEEYEFLRSPQSEEFLNNLDGDWKAGY